jgi:hypothetical protein
LHEAPLDAEDEYYIYHKEDIVTLKPGRENAWLDGVIETLLGKVNCRLVRVSPFHSFPCFLIPLMDSHPHHKGN